MCVYPPVPVLAWRDPAAARDSAPLAPLATQVIILYSIYILFYASLSLSLVCVFDLHVEVGRYIWMYRYVYANGPPVPVLA